MEAKEVWAPALAGKRPASETAAVLQPFTLLSFTPTKRGKSGSARLELAGHEAITLTFSHAVIALGSDFSAGPLPKELTPFEMTPPVAGRVRWVTTSVVRFDPEGEWPPELELVLSLKPGLSTFDGRTLARNEPSRWEFRTPALSMRVGRVSSASASELTDRTWSAALHPLAPGAVEVPPDATFELHFSADVEAHRVSASLELRLDEVAALVSGAERTNLRAPASANPGAPRTIALRTCPAASARCVLAEVRPPLAVGRLFRLALPAGAVVHSSAGATHAAATVSLSGLVPFAFPFRPLEHVREYSRPSYRRHHLWLRHGLEANTSLDLLAAQLHLEISSPATSPATSAATSAATAAATPTAAALSPLVSPLESPATPATVSLLDRLSLGDAVATSRAARTPTALGARPTVGATLRDGATGGASLGRASLGASLGASVGASAPPTAAAPPSASPAEPTPTPPPGLAATGHGCHG